jgi:hypothetical protein
MPLRPEDECSGTNRGKSVGRERGEQNVACPSFGKFFCLSSCLFVFVSLFLTFSGYLINLTLANLA